MTDPIVVPVTAPGSQQATAEMLRAADAAKKLAASADQVIMSGNRASGVFSKNNTVLAQLTRSLNDASKAQNNMGGGTGPNLWGKMFSGHGGEFNMHAIEGKSVRLMSMMGGGEVAHTIHGIAMSLGTLGPLLGGLGAAALLATMAVKKKMASEEAMMDFTEKWMRSRNDLLHSMESAREGQQDSARSLHDSLNQTRRFLFAANNGSVVGEDSGDPAVMKAMEKAMSSKAMKNLGMTEFMNAVDTVYRSGAADRAGSIDLISSQKGRDIDVNDIIAERYGKGKREGSVDFTNQMIMRTGDYDRNFKDYNQLKLETDRERLAQSRDNSLIMPSMNREADQVWDPVQVVLDKWKKAHQEEIDIMKARVDLQSNFTAWLEKNFGGKDTEQRKYNWQKLTDEYVSTDKTVMLGGKK